MLNQFKRGNLFFKTFSLSLYLIIFMTLFNTFTIHIVSKNAIDSLSTQQTTSIHSELNQIDIFITHIKNLTYYLENSMNNLIFSNKLSLSKALFSQMATIQNTVPYLSDLYIYLFDSPYLYHSGGLIEPITYFNNRYAGDTDNFVKWTEYLHPTEIFSIQSWDIPILDEPASSVSPFNITKIIFHNSKPVGTIVFNINENIFTNLIGSTNSIIICDLDNNILMHYLNTPLEQPLLEEVLSPKANTSNFIQDVGLVTSTTSLQYDLKYISIFHQSNFIHSLHNLSLVANSILFLIAFLLSLLTYKISKSTYQPIGHILNTLSLLPSSKKTDFETETEYIEYSILSLVNTNKNLESTLSSTKPFLNKAFLLNILLGNQPEMVQHLIAQEQFNFPNALYTTLAIRHELLIEQDKLVLSQNNQIFLEAIESLFGHHLYACIVTAKNEYSLVLSYESKEDALNLPQLLPELCTILQEILPYYSFYVGLGDFTEDIFSLQKTFIHAEQALKCYKVQSKLLFNIYDNSMKYFNYCTIEFFQQELMSVLQKNNSSTALHYVRNLLDKYYNKNISLSSYISLCLTINECLTSYILLYAKQDTLHLLDIDANQYVYTPERLNDIIFYNLNEVLQTQKDSPNPLLQDILEYIDINFNQNINLASLSDSLGYNANYISRYFKQSMGVNFTQYLTQRKIEYAKHLILTTKMTIKEIGEVSGFNSTNLFIKSFEQLEGITPGKFRKKFLKDNL